MRPLGWQVLQLLMNICSPVRLVDLDASVTARCLFTSSMRLISSPIEHADNAIRNGIVAKNRRLL